MFRAEKDWVELARLLDTWPDDLLNVKKGFKRLIDTVSGKGDVVFEFVSRPGISYSLRVKTSGCLNGERGLFLVIDIVDDDPENRWLSVCFYDETVTDPLELGNLIPAGLFGEDGYCFDVMEYDDSLLDYLRHRINEAWESASRIN